MLPRLPLVDPIDADLLTVQWRTSRGNEYPAKTESGRVRRLHLEIAIRMGIEAPEIDHINNNPLDCRRNNLRPATHLLNMQNRRMHRNNTSGERGVRWDAERKRWIAYARLGGQYRYLGRFREFDAAKAMVRAWRAQHMPFSAEARVQYA